MLLTLQIELKGCGEVKRQNCVQPILPEPWRLARLDIDRSKIEQK
jgi:hypothetical protein